MRSAIFCPRFRRLDPSVRATATRAGHARRDRRSNPIFSDQRRFGFFVGLPALWWVFCIARLGPQDRSDDVDFCFCSERPNVRYRVIEEALSTA
jgi:hypothetical protein